MEIGPNDALGAPRSLDVITPARNYPVFAGLQLLRNAFGVGQGAWSSGQWVALEVGVDIDIVATRRR
ncbi:MULTISPECIES: hypothetical protein [Sphingomonadaceae]|uniref:hypothetical protein n=1 Tax=Sphingomonadales TaxID=204457 RepID=UPI0019CF8925|nr:hypothetical protein [Sphingobium yanoikuyae]